MAIAIVKSKLTTASSTSASSTFTSGSAAANNLLLAIVTFPNTGAVTGPSGYTLIDGPRTANSNKSMNVYAKKAAGGETTATATGTTGRNALDLIEVSGMSVTDIDNIINLSLSIQAATDDSAGTGVTTDAWPSVDPSQSGEVLMLAPAVLSAAPGSSPTWLTGTAGYATLEAPPANCRAFTGWKVGTGLGAQVPEAAWTTSAQTLLVLFVLPAAAAGGGGQPPRTMHQSRLRRAA